MIFFTLASIADIVNMGGTSKTIIQSASVGSSLTCYINSDVIGGNGSVKCGIYSVCVVAQPVCRRKEVRIYH
jgi:hypothetical protein